MAGSGRQIIMKRLTALILIGFLFQIFSLAQAPSVPNVSPGEPQAIAPEIKIVGPAEMTAADVEAFLEGVVPVQLALDDIAGATVAVVKDGKILFTKGYGYADAKEKKPVSPAETLFRPGSVSKLFTWTAVMQLFEQGKLDLDRDVNEYLDFRIPKLVRRYIPQGPSRS